MSDPETCAHYAKLILDRHLQAGVKEAEIGVAVRDFLIQTGLVSAGEEGMEQPPAPGASGRVDLRTRDVIIEFKVRIGNQISPQSEFVEQLDDYLQAARESGEPQRFGILTDGKYWILRYPGMGAVSTQAPNAFTLSSAEHGLLLYEWLRDRSQALEERGVPPTEDRVRDRLGGGVRFERHLASLTELYQANRDDPTIALKRDLWRSLLAAALGQVVEEEPDLDRLFVRHTYLSVVVGLAVQAAFGIPIEAAANSDPVALLGGQLFVDQTGVSGVVESDFFTWPAEVGGEEWIRVVAQRIGWFDWNEAESDIARILYESVIPADDRRRLGEYYTPDWLAREIVDAVVTDPLNQRVLDPACGSGSFIFAAVRKYLTAAQADGRSSAQAVEGLLDHVIGIDVHPVAVHLARATWTLAARDALEGAVAEGQSVSATVPVYLGDSLQLRAETSGMFAQQTVTIPVPDPPDSDVEFNRELEFPRALVEQADWFDNLMTRMANAIENGEDPAWALDDEAIGSGSDREMLEKTAALLQQLHEEGRDHIWAYYTRNLVRPVALRADPVDVIVGNPPWITYNKTQAVVREELVRLSKRRYKLWSGGRYATHQDVAGLFFARCAELYLNTGGAAAMVLPHSALQAGQYSKWRSGDWGIVFVDLGVRPPWDLERIEPNDFFPVPASVVFLRKRLEVVGKPLPSQADRWRGSAGGPFIREKVGLIDTSGDFASPYGEFAHQGASIVPRVLFWVQVEESKALVQAADTVTVTAYRSGQEKGKWKELDDDRLKSQPIESRHIFAIQTSDTLAPYRLFEPRQAVLPIDTGTTTLRNEKGELLEFKQQRLGSRMRKRWRTINELWLNHKNDDTKLSLIEQLDFMSKLSSQLPVGSGASVRVVYGTSGKPTAATLSATDVLLDTSVYEIPCVSAKEASYLCAILNSRELERAIEPLMPKGQFGARHVHKHPWRLPIPEYGDSDSLHVELAEAGEAAAIGAKALWDAVRVEREAKGQSTSVTVARREIRQWLSESAEGQRVEELVSRLLGGQRSR